MVHYDSCEKLAGLLNSISYKAPLSLLNRFNEPENYRLNSPQILFDTTHDNEPYGSKNSAYSVENYLVSSYLTTFAEGTGSATTFGSDQGIS